jgi:hypothetical protein
MTGPAGGGVSAVRWRFRGGLSASCTHIPGMPVMRGRGMERASTWTPNGGYRASCNSLTVIFCSGILRRLTDGSRACPPRPGRRSLGSVPVDRIAIIGCGGSGKSHLARTLGSALSPPTWTACTTTRTGNPWTRSSPPCSATSRHLPSRHPARSRPGTMSKRHRKRYPDTRARQRGRSPTAITTPWPCT